VDDGCNNNDERGKIDCNDELFIGCIVDDCINDDGCND